MYSLKVVNVNNEIKIIADEFKSHRLSIPGLDSYKDSEKTKLLCFPTP